MHWTLEQFLWALTLAGHLVLLIVMLGRDRIQRFPWFTAAVTISTVRLLADHLLHGKLTTAAFYWQTYSLLLVSAIIGILVLAELAWQVFGSGRGGIRLKAYGWIGWTLATFIVAVATVVAIGPWPSWESMSSDKSLLALRLVWVGALKLDFLVGLLAVEIMLLLLAFGKRFGFSWRSQPTLIAIGLSTIAISQYSVQGVTQSIVRNAHPNSREEYARILRLLTNLDHGRVAIWCVALIWWIVWLWRDERGKPTAAEAVATPELVSAVPDSSGIPAEDPKDPA